MYIKQPTNTFIFVWCESPGYIQGFSRSRMAALHGPTAHLSPGTVYPMQALGTPQIGHSFVLLGCRFMSVPRRQVCCVFDLYFWLT